MEMENIDLIWKEPHPNFLLCFHNCWQFIVLSHTHTHFLDYFFCLYHSTWYTCKGKENGICFYFSERRPGRSDLIVLVAHNDDPTGKKIILCVVCLSIIYYGVHSFIRSVTSCASEISLLSNNPSISVLEHSILSTTMVHTTVSISLLYIMLALYQ